MSNAKPKQERNTITTHLTLPPSTHAALAFLADLDAGGGRGDATPVVTRLVRRELEQLIPGAWTWLSCMDRGDDPLERSKALQLDLRDLLDKIMRARMKELVEGGGEPPAMQLPVALQTKPTPRPMTLADRIRTADARALTDVNAGKEAP